MRKNIKYFLLLIFFVAGLSAFAGGLRVNKIFGSNMVLQRNEQVLIWGKSKELSKVKVYTSWNDKTYTCISDKNRDWQVTVETADAGGPYYITISSDGNVIELNNILLGEVWLCAGQSNMEMPLSGFMGQSVMGGNRETALASRYKNIRIFQEEQARSDHPEEELTVWHSWSKVTSKTISDFSAVGWFFGKLLNEALDNIPIGLIQITWGGTPAELWISRHTMGKFTEISPDSVLVTSEHYGPLKPSMLYNAMIHPVINLKFKGVIWYQGESNVKRASSYQKIFTGLIQDWREQFGFDFPFYFVQIAPFYYYENNSAFLREAQLKTMQNVDKTGMVVTLDTGEWNRIHPGRKREVGERLAYWALAKDYGFEKLGCTAPVYKKMIVKDTIAYIYFDRGEIAERTEQQLEGNFEIAGPDHKFYPAKARILEWNDFVEVWNRKVPEPVAVRYCFKNWCKGKLFGTNELPVSSFRTDNWDK